MKTKQGILRYLVIGQLLFCFEGAAWAQGVDPTKALIGTWEGWAGRNLARTLVIKTVSRNEDGSWMAQGNYGIIGQKLGRRTMNVSVQGGDVELNFFTGAQSQVHLKLVGDNKLVGMFYPLRQSGTGSEGLIFELAKVQPDHPTRALIGTWEGLLRNTWYLTIIIRTVNPKEDGSWNAEGSFGFTGQKLGRQTMNVSVQGRDIELNFFTIQKYPVDLKLAGDHKLVGKMSGFAGRTTSGSTMRFELEKVQPK
jgi:hypothetical protein